MGSPIGGPIGEPVAPSYIQSAAAGPEPQEEDREWGRSSLWEILHNPKYTGFMVWNRRQRKRGGKIDAPEKWSGRRNLHTKP
jgi:hypothetical protein